MGHKRGHYKKRQPKPIRRLDGDQKHCPNSLREILNHIRETADEGGILSHVLYTQALDKAWDGPRYGIHTITDSIFQATEDGTHTVEYYHLEAYARELGVPSGLLLLLSRLHADNRGREDTGTASGKSRRTDAEKEADRREALSVIHGVRAALDQCEIGLLETGKLDVRGAVAQFRVARSKPSS